VVLAIPVLMWGCTTSVNELTSKPPATFHTTEAPGPALSKLALAADDLGLRVELFDRDENRMIAGQPPQFLFTAMVVRYLVETRPDGDGAEVNIWCDWPKKHPQLLWDAYVRRRDQPVAEVAASSTQ